MDLVRELYLEGVDGKIDEFVTVSYLPFYDDECVICDVEILSLFGITNNTEYSLDDISQQEYEELHRTLMRGE